MMTLSQTAPPWGRRRSSRAVACCLALLAMPLLVACSATFAPDRPQSTPPEPHQPEHVLDYRNGWYHPSDGTMTLAEIAGKYRREAQLVAQLHRMDAAQRPEPGMMVYIPPTDDRGVVRELLVRLQRQPEVIPRIPWDYDRQAPAHEPEGHRLKAAPADLKSRIRPAARPVDAPPIKVAATDRIKTRVASGDLTLAEAGERNAAAAPVRRAVPRAFPFMWPLEGLVVTRFREGWSQSCHGVEIEADRGTPVRAARGGEVIMAQDFLSYGNLIVIDHGDGYATAYGYNQNVRVSPGQRVEARQQIAEVGRDRIYGREMLFFQIRRNGQPVDPLKFLPEQARP